MRNEKIEKSQEVDMEDGYIFSLDLLIDIVKEITPNNALEPAVSMRLVTEAVDSLEARSYGVDLRTTSKRIAKIDQLIDQTKDQPRKYVLQRLAENGRKEALVARAFEIQSEILGECP